MPFPLDQYALPAAVTVAGIHQLVRFTKAVGQARHKFDVKVPETTGPPEFVRTFRAHQNTLEFYPVSLTGLWLGSVFFHPVPASVVYTAYLFGRHKFFYGYIEAPEKRVRGFKISVYCLMGLIIMSVAGIGHKLVRYYGDIDLYQMICDRLPICDN